ncbi:MAG: DUF4156 domain-containing protein [Pseudomonadales bacterium]
MNRWLIVALAFALLQGCATFVKLTPAGEGVQIGYGGDLNSCELLGRVNVNTEDKVLVRRDPTKVQEELNRLARNNAAGMGATHLIPHALPEDGSQTFSAYRCPPA